MDPKKISIKKRGDDCDYITYNQRHPKNDTCIAFDINLLKKSVAKVIVSYFMIYLSYGLFEI